MISAIDTCFEGDETGKCKVNGGTALADMF